MLSRRKFLRLAGGALAAAPLLPTALTAAARAAGTFTEIRRGVGIFTERGGTIGWLANAEALVVVDTQYPETAETCLSGLQKRAEPALDLVINTHHHGDHTGGNGVFANHTDRIVAHANVPDLQRQSAARRDDGPEPTVPTETFDETWSTDAGDETIRLHHFGPAHTGGDAVIHFEKANVMHVGDLVFNRAYPFIDVGGGADTANWMTTLQTIHDTADADTQIIFGHGNPEFGVTGTRSDLLVMRDFLGALRTYVSSQIESGASLDEMKQIDALDGFESFNFDWPLPLSRCVEAVHTEMTA